MAAQEAFFAENGFYASSHALLDGDTLKPCQGVSLSGGATGLTTYTFTLSFRGLNLTVTQDGVY